MMTAPNCPQCKTPMPEVIHESEDFITYRCDGVQLLVDKRRSEGVEAMKTDAEIIEQVDKLREKIQGKTIANVETVHTMDGSLALVAIELSDGSCLYIGVSEKDSKDLEVKVGQS